MVIGTRFTRMDPADKDQEPLKTRIVPFTSIVNGTI